MLERLFGRFLGGALTDADEPEVQEEETPKEELYRLHKGEEGVNIIGLPKGARADQIERLTLIQMGPGTSEQDCIDFLNAIREALPPNEANNVIVTRETNISVFRWKKVEEKVNG